MKHDVSVYFVCWFVGLIGLVPLAMVLQVLLPRFLRRTSENLERTPWWSLLMGAVTALIAMLAINLTMQAGGLGHLIGGALAISLGVMVLLGFTASLRTIGGRLFFGMNNPRADLAIPSTMLGGIVLGLAAVLVVPGGVLLLLMVAAGCGASLISLFGKTATTPVATRS